MSIAIASMGEDKKSSLSARFGRAPYFLILSKKGELIKSIPNQGQKARRGAGIAAAQEIVSQGVEVVITGNMGPNAFRVLKNNGLQIFLGPPDKNVQQVFEDWQNGSLSSLEQPRGFGK